MHGKVLDSASHKNKLPLWNVFVKRLPDGWRRVSPMAGPGRGRPAHPRGPAGRADTITQRGRALPSLNFHFLLHFVSDTTLVSETEELALLFTLCFSELSCVGGFVLNMPIEPGPAPHRAAVFALMGNFRFFFFLKRDLFLKLASCLEYLFSSMRLKT